MFDFLKSGLQKMHKALSKTKDVLSGKIRSLFQSPWDEEKWEELEKILYEADLGSSMTQSILQQVRTVTSKGKELRFEDVMQPVRSYCLSLLKNIPSPPTFSFHPLVILIVGVNGGGKTTSIAKLAYFWKN